MYSRGLQSFMTAKKLKSKQTIDAFLKEQGITHFTSKDHYKVNNYIEKIGLNLLLLLIKT